jgi:hypothetical protein
MDLLSSMLGSQPVVEASNEGEQTERIAKKVMQRWYGVKVERESLDRKKAIGCEYVEGR